MDECQVWMRTRSEQKGRGWAYGVEGGGGKSWLVWRDDTADEGSVDMGS